MGGSTEPEEDGFKEGLTSVGINEGLREEQFLQLEPEPSASSSEHGDSQNSTRVPETNEIILEEYQTVVTDQDLIPGSGGSVSGCPEIQEQLLVTRDTDQDVTDGAQQSVDHISRKPILTEPLPERIPDHVGTKESSNEPEQIVSDILETSILSQVFIREKDTSVHVDDGPETQSPSENPKLTPDAQFHLADSVFNISSGPLDSDEESEQEENVAVQEKTNRNGHQTEPNPDCERLPEPEVPDLKVSVEQPIQIPALNFHLQAPAQNERVVLPHDMDPSDNSLAATTWSTSEFGSLDPHLSLGEIIPDPTPARSEGEVTVADTDTGAEPSPDVEPFSSLDVSSGPDLASSGSEVTAAVNSRALLSSISEGEWRASPQQLQRLVNLASSFRIIDSAQDKPRLRRGARQPI